jgi:hypothetical protein
MNMNTGPVFCSRLLFNMDISVHLKIYGYEYEYEYAKFHGP